MAKKKCYLPWEPLREYIRGLGLSGRAEYIRWWEENTPAYAPKRPNRVFLDEWVSWNDYLGTNNRFGNPHRIAREHYRPYWDAVRYVHTLKLKTSKQYYQWARSDERPADIPDRPDAVYNKEWVSWEVYLGASVVAAVEVAKELEQCGLIALVRMAGQPGNLVHVIADKKGENHLKEHWPEQATALALYVMPPDMSEFRALLDQLSTPYYGDTNIRVANNVNDLIYWVGQLLDRYQLPR